MSQVVQLFRVGGPAAVCAAASKMLSPTVAGVRRAQLPFRQQGTRRNARRLCKPRRVHAAQGNRTCIVTALTAAQWISTSGPALATACPVQITSDFVSENWSNGNTYMDVNGVRAPILTRLDGTVCGGGPEVGFDAAWISLEARGGVSITQIGFIHQSIPGGQEYCRFWG